MQYRKRPGRTLTAWSCRLSRYLPLLPIQPIAPNTFQDHNGSTSICNTVTLAWEKCELLKILIQSTTSRTKCDTKRPERQIGCGM